MEGLRTALLLIAAMTVFVLLLLLGACNNKRKRLETENALLRDGLEVFYKSQKDE